MHFDTIWYYSKKENKSTSYCCLNLLSNFAVVKLQHSNAQNSIRENGINTPSQNSIYHVTSFGVYPVYYL